MLKWWVYLFYDSEYYSSWVTLWISKWEYKIYSFFLFSEYIRHCEPRKAVIYFHHCCVGAAVLSVFANYLSIHQQVLKINDFRNSITVALGIPQRTVLGPMLFLLYMNNKLALTSYSNILSLQMILLFCLKEIVALKLYKICMW